MGDQPNASGEHRGRDAGRPASAEALADLPGPLPAAGLAAYLAEREAALAASPAKRANFEKYRAARRGEPVSYLPIKLDIENVSRCNFRCTMCIVSEWERGRRAADLPLDSFRRLIDEQVGLVEIKLQGVGEPLLQRGEFFAMIRTARARRIWVRTTTNASLLHLADNCRQLVDADPNEIQVSVDGARRASFEAIRRGSVFERVVGNCRRLNAYCAERGVARTKMWTVVQERNAAELPELVDLAASLGFKTQVFSLNVSDWGLDGWASRLQAAGTAACLAPERLHALVERGRALGVAVQFWAARDRYRLGDPATLCPWPFERAYVASDCRVVPCCYIGNPDVFQIGEALSEETSFADVWLGPDYDAFRRAHLRGEPPEICRRCYKAEGAPHPG